MFYSTALPKSPDSAAQARLFLEPLRAHVGPEVLENARLLTSELVANAIEHVREQGDIELRIVLSERVLRVEVLDPGPGFTPPPRPADSDRGWGLHFTELLALRWDVGVDGRAGVWFELALNEA